MKSSANKIYSKTLEDLFSKLSSQIKEFQAAAPAAAAEITAKQQAKAKDDDEKSIARNDAMIRKFDQLAADRRAVLAGRVWIGPSFDAARAAAGMAPYPHKPVPAGTAAKAAGTPATKKPGT